MKDQHREDLENRVNLARELCVQSLRNIIWLEELPEGERKQAATRALKQMGVARRNLARYDRHQKVTP